LELSSAAGSKIAAPLRISCSFAFEKSRPREAVMNPLSELELAVLGIVWKKGPCTPYAIRKEFLTSPTPHFSGSAGAIYPLVRRLEDRRLLVSEPDPRGRKARILCTLTRRGRSALSKWLTSPVRDEAASPVFDPLRLRVFFLAALSRRQRRLFLDRAVDGLAKMIPVLDTDRKRYIRSGDRFSQLASDGMMQILKARIKWMKAIRLQLETEDLI
jgi:DNA-binding PadR family transcriptional regulator